MIYTPKHQVCKCNVQVPESVSKEMTAILGDHLICLFLYLFINNILYKVANLL